MKPLDTAKLEHYRKQIGALTSAEALQLAIEAEQFKKDCGPLDPAFEFFANQQRVMESYAVLLEQEENEAHETAVPQS